VGARRTAWHFLFSILLRERGPSWIEVRPEVPLGKEPPRVDFLMLRRTAAPTGDPGQTLRGLWPRLPLVSIVELKTVGRPYRSGDLDRLWSYLHTFFADAEEGERPANRNDLAGVLIVPKRTPSLNTDLDAMGLVVRDLGYGYAAVEGGLFGLLVAEVDVVAEGENDDLLRLFGHTVERTREARRFWARFVGSREADMAVREMEGFDEVMQKLLDVLTPQERVAGLAPQERVAGLAPQERVAGLRLDEVLSAFKPEDVRAANPEHLLLALPDELLRGLSDEYVKSLPEHLQKAIRDRLGR